VPEQGTDIGNVFHGITFLGGMRNPPWVASEDPCSGQMISFLVSTSSPARG
jgi:hypothetical protein